jgi:hypothetical protein
MKNVYNFMRSLGEKKDYTLNANYRVREERAGVLNAVPLL